MLSFPVSLINTAPSLPSSSCGYFYTPCVLAVLVPAKGRESCDGHGVHLLGVGGGSGAGARPGLSELRSSCQRLAILLFPNMGGFDFFFFQDFQFCRILNYTCFGQLRENPHSFSPQISLFFSYLYIPLSHTGGGGGWVAPSAEQSSFAPSCSKWSALGGIDHT